jgi:inner membrane protein
LELLIRLPPGALVLLGTDTASALRSVRRGLAVAGAIGATYGFLYGLVIAEDYALLMRTIAVFVALAIVMLVTRRIDWYRRAADV